ncbi:MAG: hypothetical protein SFU53_00640 [Terrimicrobiaceae bacterium]|nr:hypothetical protein [Terrimicrobiaceae bacterium]
MNNPNLAAFGNAVQASADLRDRLAAILAAPESERLALLVAFSTEIGHPVSQEEWAALAEASKKTELTAEELETVAGGIYLGQPDFFEQIGIKIGQVVTEVAESMEKARTKPWPSSFW